MEPNSISIRSKIPPLRVFKVILCIKTSLIVLLSFVTFFADCQRIDSLKSLLHGKTGPERAYLLYELAYEYVDFDYLVAQQYSSEAFTAARLLNDSLLLVKSGRIGALALSRNNENDSSVALSSQILPIARRNFFENELKHILNRLGAGYNHKGKYDSALVYHFESLALREKTGDQSEIIVALNNIGIVYYSLKDYNKALSFFLRSLEGKMKITDQQFIEFTLLNISLCYAYLGQLDLARHFVNRAFEQCGRDCSSNFLMRSNFNLGLISYGLRDFKEAESQFSKSFLLSEELGDMRYQLDNLVYLLEMDREINHLNLDRKLLFESEARLKNNTTFRLASMKLCHQLFESYRVLGYLQKTSFYQSKYIQLRDSIYSAENTTNLMKVEADYMEKENNAKIEAQTKILALNEDVISRQRALNIVIAAVAALSIALAITLVQNIKQKKRANALLELKVRERTIELETNHTESLKALEKRNQQMKRISLEINSSVATIRGLCELSNQDASVVNAGQYISKIEAASDRLQSGILRTLGIGENVAS